VGKGQSGNPLGRPAGTKHAIEGVFLKRAYVSRKATVAGAVSAIAHHRNTSGAIHIANSSATIKLLQVPGVRPCVSAQRLDTDQGSTLPLSNKIVKVNDG
jgi:hypothetical protein